MNPYQFEMGCDVCGGPGVGTARTAGAAWVKGVQIRHADPEVCAMYLERKRERLEKLAKRVGEAFASV